jgi:chromosome segregation ATPase
MTDLSPHAQLLEAFAALKKEKESLVMLTALQKKDFKALSEELDASKKALEDEKKNVKELEAKLDLKAVSAECQIAEVESFSKGALEEALEKNSQYSEKIVDLEFEVGEVKKERERLLERTAALARRDQIQKVSISTLTEEIESLTTQVKDFEDQFSSLASRSAEMHEEAPVDDIGHERDREEWAAEKNELVDRIASLESSCDKMKDAENLMKDTFVQTLSRHKDQWYVERKELKKRVRDLMSEKETIEDQVKEIAAMLEADHLERHGRPFSEDEMRNPRHREPVGVKALEVYDP